MDAMWYAEKFDEASRQLLSTLGLTSSRLRNEQTSGGIRATDPLPARTARRRHCDHSHAVLEIMDKSIRFIHEMRNDEAGKAWSGQRSGRPAPGGDRQRDRSLPSDVRERAVLGIGDRDYADRNAFARMLKVIRAPRPQEQPQGGCKL
jgi:acyl-CoA thioester hydrolase